MDQDHFPWPAGRRLPPELFDHYIAKARVERAKAIAEFCGWIGRQLRGVAVRFAARPGRRRARKVAG